MARTIQVARFSADGSQVERTFDSMGKAGDQNFKKIKDGAKSVPPALRAVDESASIAKEKVADLAKNAGPLGRVLGAIGPAGLIAAAGIGAGIVAFTALQGAAHAAVQELGATETAARRLGVTTDALQELRFAALGAGVDLGTVERGIEGLNSAIGEITAGVGTGGLASLHQLGFSNEDIRNFHGAEDALTQIADRMHNLSTADQTAIADKLKIKDLLPLLQEGGDALRDYAEEAHRTGYVLDQDLLKRARELNGEWAQADAIIDLQLKKSLVELAPIFVTLATGIAQAATALGDFLDKWRGVNGLNLAAAQTKLQQDLSEFADLNRQYGLAHGQGDAERGDHTTVLFGLGARNRQAFLQQEIVQLQQRIQTLNGAAAISGNAPTVPGLPPLPTTPAANPLTSFVDTLRQEADMRDRVAAAQAQNAALTREEATSQAQLTADLDKLNQARAEGVITSDAELQRLITSRQARDADAAATRAQAEAERQAQQATAARAALLQQVETPLEALNRQIAELHQQQSQFGLPDDLVARRIAQLTAQYQDMAAAQREASFEGQVLNGIMQDQIHSLADIEQMLVKPVANDVMKELFATGVNGPGGVGGFASRVGGRVIGDLGLGGLQKQNPGVTALNQAASQTAASLLHSLTPSAAQSAAKIIVSATATTAETAARGKSTAASLSFWLASNQAGKSLVILAAAAMKAAGSMGGKGASGFVSEVANIITGAGAPKVSGGGHASGGSMVPGALYGGAEKGTELAIFGGWAHVAPNDAVQGLALLGKLSRAAPAPPTSPPSVRVELTNASGVAIEASAASAAFDENGALAVRVALRRQVAADFGQGHFDAVMKGRFGAQPARTRRG